MPLTREKKESILKDIKDKIKKAKIVLFVNFHGLSVSMAQEIRRALRKAGADYLVVKKTLLNRALDEFKFSEERPELEGEIALVFGAGDEISAPREVSNFGKTHKELRALGGVLESKYINEATIKTLASILPKEVLLGQFARVVSSPLQQLVSVLQAPMRDFLSVLNQIKK